MTNEQILARETAPRDIQLWGEPIKDFVPYLCKTKLGDGKQLIYFGVNMQRPRYWLVLIDSKTNFDEWDVEDVIGLIEDECGYVSSDEEDVEYPEICYDGGCHYGMIAMLN